MTPSESLTPARHWRQLEASLSGLHRLALTASTMRDDVEAIVVAVALREALDRICQLAGSSGGVPELVGAGAPVWVRRGRASITELLALPVVHSIEPADLLLLARVAHLLARAEDLLTEAAA
jgi:hypothetical protein